MSDFSFDDFEELELEVTGARGRGQKGPIRLAVDDFVSSNKVLARWDNTTLPVVKDASGKPLSPPARFHKCRDFLGSYAKKRREDGLDPVYLYYVLKDSIILLNLNVASDEEVSKFVSKNPLAVKGRSKVDAE